LWFSILYFSNCLEYKEYRSNRNFKHLGKRSSRLEMGRYMPLYFVLKELFACLKVLETYIYTKIALKMNNVQRPLFRD